MKRLLLLGMGLLVLAPLYAQEDELLEEIKALRQQVSRLRHNFDVLEKNIDDLLWHDRVGDVAYIDKVYMTGPPLPDRVERNKNRQGYGNPLKFQSYIFIPRGIDPSKKYPLLVFPHGGVHSDFNTYYTHIIRELMAQGYVVVAPEYRGSTGYGRRFYESIDYGGLEVEDVYSARNYMVENYDLVDKNRIGILGWSHGGLITLMNIFEHPNDYKVAYAGVPVSDLIARMGYKTQGYRDLYSADFHIGQTAYQNVEEYRKRSPAWQAHKLETPLLIHTNTNDEDVNVFEVEHLIKTLKAEEKEFEYEIYEDIQGGHAFDRLDTKVAQEIRVKIYKFLNGYLNPPNPINNRRDLRKAAYGF
ncbi:MAG TPA: S9 family peptidase [Cytophagales bacterium]|nr:S9 family peptidase [Cytophagales bacterium]HAA22399.1 S9 family peptidase [Cytophagales bacterium]HAP59971.1 S9 family peptidase [Cytophagales bacterium]